MPRRRIFGVEWVIRCADGEALKRVKPLFDSVRMKDWEDVRTATSLSGSAAYMGRTNPYPADLDFIEIVLVKAPSLDDAARRFAGLLRENVENLVSLDFVRFSELKIGADAATGRALKWSLEEIRSGWKTAPGGEPGTRVALHEAALQRGAIKLDVFAAFDGNWKELTKVFRFAYVPESSKGRRNIRLLTTENLIETIYQEIFFSRKEAALASSISRVKERGGFGSPAVIKKYRDLMDVEIAHYGALGAAEKTSHLKLLKRWFNKLRLERDYKSVDTLSDVFKSPANALNELKEMARALLLAVERGALSPDEVSSQIGRFDELFGRHCRELVAEKGTLDRGEFEEVRRLYDGGERTSALERLRRDSAVLEEWIEGKARGYLTKAILDPYAERLGILVGGACPSRGKDFFKGITEGNKMRYLVNRYLREDPRVARRSFRKGETIIQFGEKAACCYIVLDGRAVVGDSSGDPVNRHIRDVGPYTMVGEIALVHKGGRRTAEIVAGTTVEALEIPHVVFRELMNDDSFRLFIDFLSTDRLMEDRARERQRRRLFGI